jgi:hypothetical protein
LGAFTSLEATPTPTAFAPNLPRPRTPLVPVPRPATPLEVPVALVAVDVDGVAVLPCYRYISRHITHKCQMSRAPVRTNIKT